MFEYFDAVMLARIQFAFTISFHIIFPAFTIGLASFLVVLEALRIKTGQKIYMEIYDLWVKIFALSFGMGVVSGLVLSYQFGTNWSDFSYKIGNVVGPLLGYEVLTAFFLEATFLGIMLFGRDKVSPRMHFTSTCIVAVGTLVSAFWILSVNSWMQTPTGYSVDVNGIFMPENWLQIIFNPSFPYRFVHMITAAYLSTAFVVAGVSGWYLIKGKCIAHAKIMFVMSMLMALFVAPLQILVGDLHGLNTLKYQPIKVAAMEGAWETETNAPFRVFAIPDSKLETNNYSLEIPYLTSMILTHSIDGEVKGLKDWSASERPPVGIVFYSFRIMLAIGVMMALTGFIALYLYFKKQLFSATWFHKWCLLLTPSGFVAVLAGWFVTEVGRQPYSVFGVLKTSDLVSPVIASEVLTSLIAFIVVYLFVFFMGIYYMVNLVKKGPGSADTMEFYGQHGVHEPVRLSEILHLEK